MVGKRTTIPILTLAAISLATLVAPRALATTTVRYASPNGTGTACSAAAPCSITQALGAAPSGTRVVLEPGNYGSPTNPMPNALGVSGGITDVGGTPGGAPVAIYSAYAGTALAVTNGTLHDVTVVTAGHTALTTTTPGVATRITAISIAAAGVACEVGSSLTDSVCLETGADGAAVESAQVAAQDLGTVTTAVRNVTAEATGANGVGLRASADAIGGHSLTLIVDATNDILHGGATDVEAESLGGAEADVILRNSDFDPARTIGGDAVDTDATDISGTPVFVNAANGNLREQPTSPTVDAGASRPAGDLDRAGNPRSVGAAPDMGAYELLVKPTITAVKVTNRTTHGFTGYVRGNGLGLSTHVTIKLMRHGKVRATLNEPTLFTHGFKVHFVIGTVARHTTFRLRAIASSIGGTTRSRSAAVTTR